MQIIDTHQHLIWRDLLGYGWTQGDAILGNGDFTPERYRAEVADCGVTGTIFMETGVDDGDYQAETRHVAGLIGQHGLLGQIASCRPEQAEGFDAWLEECHALGVNGFRRILHVMPDDLSRSDIFRRNLGRIGQGGFSFDLCLLARQLPIAAELARAFPDQVFVLDHCGVPDIAGGVFAPWAEAMRMLSGLPNLNVKLSGIAAYCAPGMASVEVLRPWVDHVLDCFGPARMVWGSDWPVVLLGSELRGWITMTGQLLAGLTPQERDMILSRNAMRIYGLHPAA